MSGAPWAAGKVLPCGTMAAWARHKRRREQPCPECTEAYRAYRQTIRPPKPRELQPCGTEAAYQRHRRRGEDPCDPCTEAMREAGRIRRLADRLWADLHG